MGSVVTAGTYTVRTATARPFSMITLSTFVLQARYRLEWTARVAWMYAWALSLRRPV